MAEMSAIDKIFDENNNDNIVLYNNKGEPVEFEQICIVPRKQHFYCILKPVVKMEGVGEDEGLVFVLNTNEQGEEILNIVTDEKIIDEVFDVYFKLLEETNAENSEE